MHSVGDLGTPGVPAFLTKLWTLVEDPSTDELICWDPSGRSFHVYEQSRFSKEVLPMYFKHSNIASFIRQLNMYGFRKVVNVEAGGFKTERDDMEFAHQCFLKDQENLLEYIKRKVPNSKSDEVKMKPGDLTLVLGDVHDIKSKQESMTSKLGALKNENEALWREVANLRQKHHKQQQIVNKLIQFLVSLVGNRGIPTRKRSMPLMLNDVPTKVSKLSRQHPLQNYSASSPELQSNESAQDRGLTIHDITDLPDSPANVAAAKINASTVPLAGQNLASGIAQIPNVTSPTSTTEEAPIDLSNLIDITPAQASDLGVDLAAFSEAGPTLLSGNTETINVLTETPAAINVPLVDTSAAMNVPVSMPVETPVAASAVPQQQASSSTIAVPPSKSVDNSRAALKVDVTLTPSKDIVVPKSPSRHELGDHVDNLQADLDAIKELLSGGSYSLDSSQLLDLFSEPSMTLPTEIFDNSQQVAQKAEPTQPGPSGIISGNELIQYSAPTEMGPIFELEDELNDDGSNLDTPSLNLETPLLGLNDSTNSQSSLLTEEVD